MQGLEVAIKELRTDLLLGLDVGGDSLAQGNEPGLRSPLADSVMLAAYAELERRGHRALWGVFGYGSDGELTVDEMELALSKLAAAGAWLGTTSLTPRIAAELAEVIKTVSTEASAIPVQCFHGAWGEGKIRSDQRTVKLTPLTALIFYVADKAVRDPFTARSSRKQERLLEAANDALHALGIRTELDLERERSTGAKNSVASLMLENLQRDVLVLMASRGIRAFAFSYLGVVFAIYLSQLGYSTVTIGLVISHGFRQRRSAHRAMGFSIRPLQAQKDPHAAGHAYHHLESNLCLLQPSRLHSFGRDHRQRRRRRLGGRRTGGGPFNPVEQALLAEKCTPENRNHIFSTNAFVGSLMGSLGALVSGLPQYLQESFGWQPVASYKPLFALTIIFSIILIFAYSTINEQHRPKREKIKAGRTARENFVTKIALLGMVDNLGAGLVGPLISYWFFRRFGVELKSLGFMFFLSYFFAALSFLAAPVLARHLGVVRTMAFSHGLASLIYLVLPLAPSFSIAAIMTVVRSFLAYMDNPLRSSFIMESSDRSIEAQRQGLPLYRATCRWP